MNEGLINSQDKKNNSK